MASYGGVSPETKFPLRIFVDLAMPPDVLTLLRDRTRGHELLLPQAATSSVLGTAPLDPQFAVADIAFGQPSVEAIAAAPRLQWIQVTSSGITRYDTPEVRALLARRKIALCNSASVFELPCALQVLSFMLAQARNLPAALQSHAANGTDEWNALRGSASLLRGQSVLILGFGAIGRRLVKLLEPLQMQITACRRKAHGDEPVPVIPPEALPGFPADHVINILPDNADSRKFFTAARFAALKPGCVFYNIGRGTTVDQEALLGALRSGHLKAAWLDVTDPEPLPPGHPLLTQPNCFITPHLAGGHVDETKMLVLHFLKNFEQFLAGKPLHDRVI
jgi:phosphoglycerate dehydrogenase-like enzyme